MKQRSRRRAAGYTLMEVVVVIGIIGIIAAIAIPTFSRMRERDKLNDAVREMTAKVSQARSLAASNQRNPAWLATERSMSAGIRFLDNRSYIVFIDRDLIWDGDEATIATVSFIAKDPGTPLTIVNPAPNTEIRMQRNGVLTAGGPVMIEINDDRARATKRIQVSLSGSTRILY
jgi:prepilin-type N-terminal cleavage/methylation domain-containing protein